MIPLTVEQLEQLLLTVTEPTTCRLKVRTKTKIPKRLHGQFVYATTLVEVVLNFDRDQSCLDRIKAYEEITGTVISIHGQTWQENVYGTPVAYHKDTHKGYLRVFPSLNAVKKVQYALEDETAIETDEVRFLLPTTGEHEHKEQPFAYLYSLSSIQVIELQGNHYRIS